MTETIIHAHPSLSLPPGWTWGTPADVPGYTARYALYESASAVVVERPDFDSEAEDQELFEDALFALEPEDPALGYACPCTED